jgi:membrane protein DedA with SNARE-associated domain
MSSVFNLDPTPLAAAHGYWIIALIVALESLGIPLPGETTLLAAAAFAGATHKLRIDIVILAAATWITPAWAAS